MSTHTAMTEEADRLDSRRIPTGGPACPAPQPNGRLSWCGASLYWPQSAHRFLVAPVAGQAAKPGKPGPSSVTITAAPNPTLYGNPVAISGRLTANTLAGVS